MVVSYPTRRIRSTVGKEAVCLMSWHVILVSQFEIYFIFGLKEHILAVYRVSCNQLTMLVA